MIKFLFRGKRIRASDKNLVYQTAASALIPLFLIMVTLLNLKTLLLTQWNTFSIANIGEFAKHIPVNIPYLIFSMVLAGILCILAAFLYCYFCVDSVKQLYHRQKLARMILGNGWYEYENVQSDGWFKDISFGNKSKEKITYFSKMYYKLKDGIIHIRVEITMGQYQEQLLKLEKKLESGLYCELIDKVLMDSYIEYTLLYDTISNRISIDEVIAEKV